MKSPAIGSPLTPPKLKVSSSCVLPFSESGSLDCVVAWFINPAAVPPTTAVPAAANGLDLTRFTKPFAPFIPSLAVAIANLETILTNLGIALIAIAPSFTPNLTIELLHSRRTPPTPKNTFQLSFKNLPRVPSRS